MSSYVVEVNNVSMRFRLQRERVDNLKEYMVRKFLGKMNYREFWGLQDISFAIEPGENWGIIGLNGAGKSTLLKLIAGVLTPTKGRVVVNGSIAPLIELGAGFDGDLTARENIFLNGAVMGLSRKEMNKHFDDIVDFSELEEFLEVPVKNFSSGMYARLGFSIATAIKPDLLIVDEILSVGDVHFQKKCEDRIQHIINSGTVILMVSHSMEQLQRVCSKVLWLDKGRIHKIGSSDELCAEYISQSS